VPALAVPWSWMEHALTWTLEVPLFVKVSVHIACPLVPAAEPHAVTAALTFAELVNDPNRPNTNPAIAMAAMSVMAMRMTVASTGEMAFLFLR